MIAKILIVLWTLFCVYGLFSGLNNVAQNNNLEDPATVIGMAGGILFWLVLWLIPTVGIYLIHKLFTHKSPKN